MSKAASKTSTTVQTALDPQQALRQLMLEMAEAGRNVLDEGFANFGNTWVGCNQKGCNHRVQLDAALEAGWTTSIAPERGCLPDGTPRTAWYCKQHSGCCEQSEEVTGAVTTGIVWQYYVRARKVTQDGHNALGTNGWCWAETSDPNIQVAVSQNRPNAKDRSAGFHDLEDRRQMGRLVLGGNQLGVTFRAKDKLTPEMWDSLELAFPEILKAMRLAFKEAPLARKRILGSHVIKLDMTVQDGVLTGRCLWDSDHQVEECCRMAEHILHLWATWFDRDDPIDQVSKRLVEKIEGKGFPQSTPNWSNVNKKRGWRK